MGDTVDRQLPSKIASAATDHYDVVILGGGMAGLTLALQIKQARPATRLLVLEKQKHPLPEAAHKVGESTLEIVAHYLRDVLGLHEHLQTQQLRKFGLRLFFSWDGNQDIARRVEYGQVVPKPLVTYHLDRGRLENMLGCELPRRDIGFLDGCKVQQIVLQHDYHRLLIRQGDSQCEILARWVVDASGRSALLKRQLGLAKPVAHHANAVWFRIAQIIDINAWSSNPAWQARISEYPIPDSARRMLDSYDPAWQARIRERERSLGTIHLMGPGYWVWLIRLASGSTSVGIVTDATMHPFEGLNRFERALGWLRIHEPQCAAVVEQHRASLQDFRVMKSYAYSAQQVYSSGRWCLTGEAAVSLDPLYSPGGDLIAISNGLICDLINRELNGEDIQSRAVLHDMLFLLLAEVWLSVYEHQYALMGNVQVMVAKIVWDTAIYWAIPGLLYFHDKFPRLSENPGLVPNLSRFALLSNRMQAFFREWHAFEQPAISDMFIDPFLLLSFLRELHIGMAAGLADAEFEAQLAVNVHFVERLAGQIVGKVIEAYADQTDNQVIQNQVQLWQTDPFLSGLIALYQQENQVNPIDSSWIALAHQGMLEKEVAG